MKFQCTTHGLPRASRKASEDAFRVQQRDDAVIAALADGIGASKEGGNAAHRAVEMIADYYSARPLAWSPRRALAEFVRRINRLFFQESALRYGSSELLCTLSVIAFEADRAYGFNAGDSPIFLLRRGHLSRLTETHTLAEPGLEHVVTRAVGLTEEIEPFFFETSIEAGDVILLCSDGVSRVVSEKELQGLLERRASARTVVNAAASVAANDESLADDASAIVIEVTEGAWASQAARRDVEVLTQLRAGQNVDEYLLVRSLQEGDRVWLAKKSDASLHVLKFPALDARDDDARREGFLREAWQATRAESSDFVRAHIPSSRALRYYVMEYVDAPALNTLLTDGPLKVEEVVALAKFLLRSCQFLLNHDLAHGDIKPENILATRTASGLDFKLLDLGSVAELFSVTSRAGTASYLAPERFKNAPVSERTEIFAIGVTLYRALTRSYPYGEIERFQNPRFDAPPRPLSKLNPTTPAWLNSVVLRAVAPEPERRYQNFSEMAYDLEHPESVAAYYRKDAPLLERNPVIFYKILCLILVITNLLLLIRLAGR